MTTAAVPVGLVPRRLAWRSLFWIAPLTLLWSLLIYWQPIIPVSGVQTTAHQLIAHGFIAVGLWLGLESTDLTPHQRGTTWLAIMIPYTLWLAVARAAAINSVFHADASRLPILPPGDLHASDHRRTDAAVVEADVPGLDAMPASWLVDLLVYRIFGCWALVAWMRGALPGLSLRQQRRRQ